MKYIAALALIVTATASASAAKTQTFTLTNVDPSVTDSTASVALHVHASGPISGTGSAQLRTIPKGGKTDHIAVRLAKGTVQLVATDTFAAVHPNYAKCRANLVGRGVFTIAGGTGAYKGASGKGTYSRSGVMVGARSAAGACLQNRAPRATYVTLKLTGTSSLPGA